MENFVVSARKYRPATFDTVVGQSHITTTLKNALKNNHLAQAFLFCGPRGVGKTTCARILAKTINCLSPTADMEACGTCDSCVAFQKNGSLNIYELDAASNNSVDDIRNLVEQVRFPPQMGKRKVYIVDEVHMLSTSAFNAFLKTLEEPPSYVIFILATTEKHKIIPTILSRCQIFDFKRIEVKDIAQHLQKIAVQEHIQADYDALELIAQKADGGLRDALSLFDMIATFSAEGGIQYQTAIDNLHILDYEYYFKMTDALLTQNIGAVMLLLDDILRKGFDGHNFIVGFSKHLRDLLVCKDAATLKLLEVTEKVKAQYYEQSKKAPLSFLISAMNIAGQCDLNYKNSKNQRNFLEIALIKIAHIPNILNLSAFASSQEAEKKNSIAEETKPNYQNQTHQKVATVQEKNTTTYPNTNANGIPKFNITDLKNQIQHKNPNQDQNTAELSDKPFGMNELRESLEHYKKINREPKVHKLINRTPNILAEHKLLFKLEEGQEEVFKSFENDLLISIRKRLQNSKITFETELLKPEEPKPASNFQKFDYLAKKNESLNELKNRLDLEIEF